MFPYLFVFLIILCLYLCIWKSNHLSQSLKIPLMIKPLGMLKASHSLLWIWLYWPRACKFPILWVLSFLFLGACNLLLSPETICGAGFVKQQEAIQWSTSLLFSVAPRMYSILSAIIGYSISNKKRITSKQTNKQTRLQATPWVARMLEVNFSSPFLRGSQEVGVFL